VARMRPLVDRLVVVVLSGRPMMLDAIVGRADSVSRPGCPGRRVMGWPTSLGDRPFTGTTPHTWP
jgi:hypothetical protein